MPQATQVLFEQREPLAVQKVAPPPGPPPPSAVPPQHASPIPPHGCPVAVLVHEPVLAEQVPLTPFAVQAWPTPTHMRVAAPPESGVIGIQQPFALQVLPVQHGCPGSPHAGAVLPPTPPAPPVPMLASRPPEPMLASPTLVPPGRLGERTASDPTTPCVGRTWDEAVLVAWSQGSMERGSPSSLAASRAGEVEIANHWTRALNEN